MGLAEEERDRKFILPLKLGAVLGVVESRLSEGDHGGVRGVGLGSELVLELQELLLQVLLSLIVGTFLAVDILGVHSGSGDSGENAVGDKATKHGPQTINDKPLTIYLLNV